MHVDESAIAAADLAKLHAEINQFRNQEFLVCSFGIALYGAAVPVLRSDPLVGIGLLFVLGGLFLWHYTLVDTRTRLVTYLKTTRQSQWELLYRDYAIGTGAPSQRTAALVTFLFLGAMTPLAAFSEGFQACFEKSGCTFWPWWSGIYAIVGSIYASVVVFYGRFENYKEKIERYERLWQKQLAEKSVNIVGLPRGEA